MNTLLGAHWQTSLFGFAAAFCTYFTQVGIAIPSNGKEWGSALLAAFLFAWGRVSADSKQVTT